MIRSQDSWNLVSNYIQFCSESTIFAGWLFSNDWCASAHLLARKCHTLHFHIDVHGIVPVVRVVPGMVHWPETWCLRSSWSQVLNPVGPRMNHVSILQNSTIALVLHSPRKMWDVTLFDMICSPTVLQTLRVLSRLQSTNPSRPSPFSRCRLDASRSTFLGHCEHRRPLRRRREDMYQLKLGAVFGFG